MVSVTVDEALCSRCGSCVQACPNGVLGRTPDKKARVLPAKSDLCFACGQCMAVCPAQAVHVGSLDYSCDFYDLSPRPSPEAWTALMSRRRSPQAFRERPVDRALLEKIVAAMTEAPVSCPPSPVRLVVVQNPDTMARLRPEIVSLYEQLLQAMNRPLGRWIARHHMGKQHYQTLVDLVLPTLRRRLESDQEGTDDLTRGAAAMILLLLPDRGPDRWGDAWTAATYALLTAEAQGLGAAFLDLLPPAVNQGSELRGLLKVPWGYDVTCAVVMGHPRIVYRRGIRHPPLPAVWIERNP